MQCKKKSLPGAAECWGAPVKWGRWSGHKDASQDKHKNSVRFTHSLILSLSTYYSVPVTVKWSEATAESNPGATLPTLAKLWIGVQRRKRKTTDRPLHPLWRVLKGEVVGVMLLPNARDVISKAQSQTTTPHSPHFVSLLLCCYLCLEQSTPDSWVACPLISRSWHKYLLCEASLDTLLKLQSPTPSPLSHFIFLIGIYHHLPGVYTNVFCWLFIYSS